MKTTGAANAGEIKSLVTCVFSPLCPLVPKQILCWLDKEEKNIKGDQYNIFLSLNDANFSKINELFT